MTTLTIEAGWYTSLLLCQQQWYSQTWFWLWSLVKEEASSLLEEGQVADVALAGIFPLLTVSRVLRRTRDLLTGFCSMGQGNGRQCGRDRSELHSATKYLIN